VLEANGAVQFFRPENGADPVAARPRSIIVEREDIERLYVLIGKDPETTSSETRLYEDPWDPSMPAQPTACAVLSPAEGFIMPQESIGKVWCEENLRFAIGWPVGPEQPATFLIQATSNGHLIEVKGPSISSFQIAIDWEMKRAVTIESP
jgi:hypothetical protein